MTTMQAVRVHEFGGPEVLRFEEATRPDPAEGEVLVRVHGAGVNPLDAKLRAGLLPDRALPFVPGWDVSGTIEWVGPHVQGLQVGEEVYTRLDPRRDGAYAEHVAVPAQTLVRKPREIDHLHAAAVPLAGLTAWQALFDPHHAELGERQTLLVHGAAGGVGHFAVQLAKWRGANVIATAAADDAGFLRELGADVIVDRRERFEDVARQVDVVLDTIGGEILARSWAVLRRGGALVSLVDAPSPELAAQHGVRASRMLTETNVRHLEELARLIDEHVVRPAVGRILPLAHARKAHELIETGHVRGKIVLDVIG